MSIEFESEYGKLLHDDFPHQYRNKEKTSYLLDAFGKQLDELKQFLFSVMIHRTLSTTRGIQLDYIGSIVGMTRAEAKKDFRRTGDLSDVFYRRALYYKIQLNFSNATASDILKYMRLYFSKIGDESTDIPNNGRDILGFHMKEEQDVPAAIILESGDGLSDADPLPTFEEIKAMSEAKIPRGGGIGIRYRFWVSEDYNNYFRVLTKNRLEVECAVEPFGSWNDDKLNPINIYNEKVAGRTQAITQKDRHTWLADELGNILADENGDIYAYEDYHLISDLYGDKNKNVLESDIDEENRDILLGEDRVAHYEFMTTKEATSKTTKVINNSIAAPSEDGIYLVPEIYYSSLYTEI